MSIVTRTGDDGSTGLFGKGRVRKDHPRIHAYGTVDELCASLGMALAEEGWPDALRTRCLQIQRLLFRVGADLATPLDAPATVNRMTTDDVLSLETWIRDLESALPALRRFILPGGSTVGAHLHLARTICRRAERWVITLADAEPVNPQVQIWLNRLSDYLFMAARGVNAELRVPEEEV